MYNALEVAKLIIRASEEEKISVNNLQLQCLLYLTAIDYYCKTGKILLMQEFTAEAYGVCIPDVYYRYCGFGAMPIWESPIGKRKKLEISQEDIIIVREIVKKHLPKARKTYNLSNETRKKGGAWANVYQNGYGVHKVIPFSKIMEI